MRRLLQTVVMGAGLAAAVAPASAATHWLCGLSRDGVRLVCLADPDELADPLPMQTGSVTPVVVRGTRFPLDPGTVYTVDLWNVPDDVQWLELLARATICYRSPGCTVSVAPVQGLPATPRPVMASR